MRTEPIVFLALVENNLQRTHSQRQHGYSDVVHLDAASFEAMEERRIFDQRVRQIKSEQDRGQRNEKYPAPGIVIGNPATEHRTHGRGENCSNAVDGKCGAALLWRKRIVENGLGHRLQAAAADALYSSKQQQERQVRR